MQNHRTQSDQQASRSEFLWLDEEGSESLYQRLWLLAVLLRGITSSCLGHIEGLQSSLAPGLICAVPWAEHLHRAEWHEGCYIRDAGVGDSTIDLLNKMLLLSPYFRTTVDDVFAHHLFNKIRKPEKVLMVKESFMAEFNQFDNDRRRSTRR